MQNSCQNDPGSQRPIEGLPVVRRNVAGIDLGSERHWVCAPTVDRAGREIAEFGAITPELMRMGKWLQERQVESVAMESTGVYWIAPHEVLEAMGLEILLVDTRQLAQVPGRDKKSDPRDCEWIQRLHSCGLLRGSFRPREEVCMLRTLVRDKANLVAEAGDWVRRMQKSLDQMKVRVHRAVSVGRTDGDGDSARHCRGRAGCPEIGATAGPTLPEERGADRRAVERALARGSPVQSAGIAEDVRRHPAGHRRLRPGNYAQAGRHATGGVSGPAGAAGEESAESPSDQKTAKSRCDRHCIE